MSAMDMIIGFDYALAFACIVVLCLIFIRKLNTWLASRE